MAFIYNPMYSICAAFNAHQKVSLLCVPFFLHFECGLTTFCNHSIAHHPYSSAPETLKLIYLLRPPRDVRQSFSQLLSVCLSSHLFHRGGAVHASNDVTTILTHLVEMLGSEVPDNVKNCGQYFWVLLKFAQVPK